MMSLSLIESLHFLFWSIQISCIKGTQYIVSLNTDAVCNKTILFKNIFFLTFCRKTAIPSRELPPTWRGPSVCGVWVGQAQQEWGQCQICALLQETGGQRLLIHWGTFFSVSHLRYVFLIEVCLYNLTFDNCGKKCLLVGGCWMYGKRVTSSPYHRHPPILASQEQLLSLLSLGGTSLARMGTVLNTCSTRGNCWIVSTHPLMYVGTSGVSR